MFPQINLQTLRQYEWVAKSVKSVYRQSHLSWTHHQLVASIDDPAKQRQWLERAAESM
jgi:hypothetical protein